MNLLRLALTSLITPCLALQLSGDDWTHEPPPEYDVAVDNGTFGYYPIRTYITAEGVTSPEINFLRWDERCDDGRSYFISPRGYSLANPSPMILDRRGDLIWARHFDNAFGGQAYDFKVQNYQGEDFLTFWLGDDMVRGHGSGSYYMLNASYDIVHVVDAANDLTADLHEFLITPEGTALMTMYQITPHNLSALRIFDPENPEDQNPNYIWDCLFQEIDIATGRLLFEWRASDHVDMNDTYRIIDMDGTQERPFDWFHINSIEKDSFGHYLISARYPHAIYYIHGRTGNIIWTLGGKSNQFMDLSEGNAINFAWQHDARFYSVDTFPDLYQPKHHRQPDSTTQLLMLFDNAAEDQHYEYGIDHARGLLLEITYPDPSSPTTATHRRDDTPVESNDEPEVIDYNTIKIHDTNGTSPAYTTRVIQTYVNSARIRSSSQGSVQILPRPPPHDPQVFVGYGLNAMWTEFAADGAVLCDVHFGATVSWERGDIQSYRAYKFPWTGLPRTHPRLEIRDDDARVWVSWNGATEVASWTLQASANDSLEDGAWSDVLRTPRRGFETTLDLDPDGLGRLRFVRMVALDREGQRLEFGVSNVVDRGVMASYFPLLEDKLAAEDVLLSPVRLLLTMVSLVSFVLIVLELYRKYVSSFLGSVGVGRLRWRKGHAYHLLNGR